MEQMIYVVEKSLIEDFFFTPALGHRNCLEGNFPQNFPFPENAFFVDRIRRSEREAYLQRMRLLGLQGNKVKLKR